MGLVLREHEDTSQSGVEAVAERKVDDPIASAEGHGRLRPISSQWMQARTDSACQNDADRPLKHESLRSGRQQTVVLLQTSGFGTKKLPADAIGGNVAFERIELLRHIFECLVK